MNDFMAGYFREGDEVQVRALVPRLAEDGSLGGRRRRVYAMGTIVRLTPKMAWVRWKVTLQRGTVAVTVEETTIFKQWELGRVTVSRVSA